MIPKRPPRPKNWTARARGRWYPKPETPVRRLIDEPRPAIFDKPK